MSREASSGEPRQEPPRPLDPRAVRVSLAAGSAAAAASAGLIEPIVVAPSSGSTAAAVDGEPVAMAIRWLDGEHLVLADATGQPGARLQLLPPSRRASTGVVRREVIVGGWRIELELESAGRAALRERATRDRQASGQSGSMEVRAIIPGVVVSVAVAVGDQVVAGQQLLAIEAMKMQNELRAPRDGTIERMAATPGQTIDVGDVLLVIG